MALTFSFSRERTVKRVEGVTRLWGTVMDSIHDGNWKSDDERERLFEREKTYSAILALYNQQLAYWNDVSNVRAD